MNLFFDLDGTLTDPKDGIVRCINYALAKLDAPPCDELTIEPFIGPPLKDTFRAILRTDDNETLMRAVSWYRERYVAEGFAENQVYDGIPELLAGCRDLDHRLFVATSKRQDIACSVLEHFGLARFFDAVYGCDVDLSKTQLLASMLREQKLRPSECVMIGDRRHDVEAALPNSIRAIGVLWGYGSRSELVAAAPAVIVSAPYELLSALDRL